jgi:hypothetical protein
MSRLRNPYRWDEDKWWFHWLLEMYTKKGRPVTMNPGNAYIEEWARRGLAVVEPNEFGHLNVTPTPFGRSRAGRVLVALLP